MRLVDLVDGYVWTTPIDLLAAVSIIPLDEFAPDSVALEEVLAHNPFSNEKDLNREDLERIWREEKKQMSNFSSYLKLQNPSGWRSRCESKP